MLRVLQDGSLPVLGVPQATPHPRVHPSGMKQRGPSHRSLGGLGCLPCSVSGGSSPVPALHGAEGSWVLCQPGLSNPLAKPSPRPILIRGGGDATPAARAAMPARTRPESTAAEISPCF